MLDWWPNFYLNEMFARSKIRTFILSSFEFYMCSSCCGRGMLYLMLCWLIEDQKDYVHLLFKIFFYEGLSNKIKGKVGFRWPVSIKVANGPIWSKPIRPSPNKLQALERPFSIKEHPFKTCLLIYLLRDRNKLGSSQTHRTTVCLFYTRLYLR